MLPAGLRGPSVSQRSAPNAIQALIAIVPFESFRAEIEAVVRLAPVEKSNAGRKPFNTVIMFKVLVLQTLYNLADEHVEYLIRDRSRSCAFWALAWKGPR